MPLFNQGLRTVYQQSFNCSVTQFTGFPKSLVKKFRKGKWNFKLQSPINKQTKTKQPPCPPPWNDLAQFIQRTSTGPFILLNLTKIIQGFVGNQGTECTSRKYYTVKLIPHQSSHQVENEEKNKLERCRFWKFVPPSSSWKTRPQKMCSESFKIKLFP